MLLIGDVHICSKFKNQIIENIRNYINNQKDEKNIIFLGDYVYHFAYDRDSLLKLYELFLEFMTMGKNIYILAGNHDWLGNNFVFEEAKKAFDIINGINSRGGEIKFITKNILLDIQGEKCLFLPYMLDIEYYDIKNPDDINLNRIYLENLELIKSNNNNEQYSAKLNNLILKYIQENDKLTIFHHYYINGINFPGQKSKFNFKDICINKNFLEYNNIKLISGHLHKAFVYNNYFCTGSTWHTTSLEANQIKGFFNYNHKKVNMDICNINPYIFFETQDETITEKKINDKFMEVIEDGKNNLQSNNFFDMQINYEENINLKKVYLLLEVDEIDFENIHKFIDKNLMEKIFDFRLKKKIENIDKLKNKIDLSNKNISTGVSDWKDILNSYIENKYEGESEKYKNILKEMKIL